jgi:hypothetical protein
VSYVGAERFQVVPQCLVRWHPLSAAKRVALRLLTVWHSDGAIMGKMAYGNVLV